MPILFGITSAGKMVPIQVDDNGLVLSQGLGWIGAAWQKNPLMFGFSGVVNRKISNASLPAGASSQDDSAVPVGEFWVITNLAIRYDGTVATVEIVAQIVVSGTSHELYHAKPPVTTQWYDRQGWWIVPEGGNLRLAVAGATLNDDAYLRASGFRVDTDQ